MNGRTIVIVCIATNLLSGCAYNQYMNAARERNTRLKHQLGAAQAGQPVMTEEHTVLTQEQIQLERELTEDDRELQQLESDYQRALSEIKNEHNASQRSEEDYKKAAQYQQKMKAKIAAKKEAISDKRKKKAELEASID